MHEQDLDGLRVHVEMLAGEIARHARQSDEVVGDSALGRERVRVAAQEGAMSSWVWRSRRER